jgi:stage V sporulation protein R
MAKKQKPMFSGSEWTFELINRAYKECEEIAHEELKLDLYPNQVEIISSDQMLELYSSVGMPVNYQHWSFGKSFLRDEFNYRKGLSGLAYEIIVNTDPCISYLMEENSMTMQTLVIAHAAMGHNSFFKNNYMFKQWTNADSIVDYLIFARDYILECESRYGRQAVEEMLDSCHALSRHGVDRYARSAPLGKEVARKKQANREEQLRKEENDLWRTLPTKNKEVEDHPSTFPSEPEENILYFIEKYSPNLENWQREIVRIVRKIAQYFYPQLQTQICNEGWASFTHHYIMTRLEEKGLLTGGQYLEFLQSHTNVVAQRTFDQKYYSGFNPYWLGFSMFSDMKRIAQTPTKEDEEWFPDIAGQNWVDVLHDGMKNYRDESFIRQFLSPKMIRENRLFLIDDKQTSDTYGIENIHNESGYRAVRSALAEQNAYHHKFPEIQVVDANMRGDRKLSLAHYVYDGILLNEGTNSVLKHLRSLWGYPVTLYCIDANDHKKILKTYELV